MRVRKIVMELVRERGVKVTYACRLFGHCRQAFYQLKAGLSIELGHERLIMENECVNQRLFNTTEEARDVIGRYIHFYNHFRPHMSLGYKVPAIAHRERGGQKKMWKRKEYKGRSGEYAGNDVSFAGLDESLGQSP